MKEGIFVKLPCNIGDTVYTIDRHDCPCEICEHGEETNYSPYKCLQLKKYYECPPPQFEIMEHICQGFTIDGDEDGNLIVSKPGQWGCEGLETFYSCDDNVYYTHEDVEKALFNLNNNK